MENTTRARAVWFIFLVSLVAIPMLLWACGGTSPTPTPTPTSGPDLTSQGAAPAIPNIQLVTLPTVDPNHPHEAVFGSNCPGEVNCMGHMYLTFASGVMTGGFAVEQLSIYTVIHDHGAPDLTGSTIAIANHQTAGASSTPSANEARQVDVYLDPAWDFKLDPNVISKSEACPYAEGTPVPDAEAKLARAVQELVPQLVNAPGGGSQDRQPFNEPEDLFFVVNPDLQSGDIFATISLPLPTPTPGRPVEINNGNGKGQVTCIIVGEDSNENGRLVLAVKGLEVVKGAVPQTPVTLTAVPTPSP